MSRARVEIVETDAHGSQVVFQIHNAVTRIWLCARDGCRLVFHCDVVFDPSMGAAACCRVLTGTLRATNALQGHFMDKVAPVVLRCLPK